MSNKPDATQTSYNDEDHSKYLDDAKALFIKGHKSSEIAKMLGLHIDVVVHMYKMLSKQILHARRLDEASCKPERRPRASRRREDDVDNGGHYHWM